MFSIYIYKLEEEKYYVGKTTNTLRRFDNHLHDKGSKWTKLYKPIHPLGIMYNCDEFDELKYTIKYMSIYGIQNVRGGPFCQINLDQSDITIINKMILSSKDNCFKCGGDHFIHQCNKIGNNIDINQNFKISNFFLNTLIKFDGKRWMVFGTDTEIGSISDPQVTIYKNNINKDQVYKIKSELRSQMVDIMETSIFMNYSFKNINHRDEFVEKFMKLYIDPF